MRLKNLYLLMRHGESEANRQGIIVSAAKNGVLSCGLTVNGINQVKQSLSAIELTEAPFFIYCSDFKRTKETAEIATQFFGNESSPVSMKRLRERNFGEFELQSDINYQRVWEKDAKNSANCDYGVEPADAVAQRVSAVIQQLEQLHQQAQILIVAHGDVLQILLSVLSDIPVSAHRQLEPIAVAGVREVKPK